MLKYEVTKEDNTLLGEISLSASKRLNNKVLTIKAIHQLGGATSADGNKEANCFTEDHQLDKQLLSQGKYGAAIRFALHYLSIYKGEWIIAVSEKLQNSSIRGIIDLLAEKQPNLSVVEVTGSSPIKIIGKNISGTISRIDVSISCDFILASMVLSPSLSEMASTNINKAYTTSPYIRQNIKLLRLWGINPHWKDDEILIENVYNDGSPIVVEADWGNASYWYQMFAISESKELIIKGLNYDTVQEDSIVKELFEPFGIKTAAHADGVILTKVKRKIKSFNHDFSNNYNLVPCFTVTCALLGVPFKIKGVNLGGRAPERAKMLKECLAQLRIKINTTKEKNSETVTFDGTLECPEKGNKVHIPAHLDHRLAMAFTPAALLGYKVEVENPTQVNTTYPGYWDDVRKLGFTVNQEV